MSSPDSGGVVTPFAPEPDLTTVLEMQQAILAGFMEIQEKKAAGRPIVWCSVLTPKEILYAMDVAAVYTELIGGYASIFGLSAQYCQAAEELGLSRDVCAVHRCAVGVACGEERDPFFDLAFAPPDLVVGSNFPCAGESKSFLYVAEKYGCPTYVIDAPINTWGKEIPDYAVDYYAEQFHGLIRFLEAHGYSLDWQKLKEQVAFSKAMNSVLEEIEHLKRSVPLPIKAYDTVIAMTAPLALPKERRTLDIFERLRDELQDRVERKIGVVPDERLRLLWVGIPPLCDFTLLNYTERYGAVVVKNMLEYLTGFTLDPALMDPERPLQAMARAQLASPANPVVQGAIDYFVRAALECKVDGVISVVKRSCAMIPGMQRLTKEAIWRAAGIPSIVFDLDGIDQREYDARATQTHLDAFVETLLAAKKGA